jgi:hypothetical protein
MNEGTMRRSVARRTDLQVAGGSGWRRMLHHASWRALRWADGDRRVGVLDLREGFEGRASA